MYIRDKLVSSVPVSGMVGMILCLGLLLGLAGCGEGKEMNEIILRSDDAYYVLCDVSGKIIKGGLRSQDNSYIDVSVDKYKIENVSGLGVVESDESKDRVTKPPEVLEHDDMTQVIFTCKNPDLEGIAIAKVYSLPKTSRTVSKEITFKSSRNEAVFLTYSTELNLTSQFRKNTYYHSLTVIASETIKDLIPASSVTSRQEANPGKGYWDAQPKIVAGVNLDEGYGVGQYRYKINGHYVWINVLKSDIPHLYYDPKGWSMGVSVTRLDPGEVTSSETHISIFKGDQLSFYDEYFKLPEVVERRKPDPRAPEWLDTFLGEVSHWSLPHWTGERAYGYLYNIENSQVLAPDMSVGVSVWLWYQYRGDMFPEGTFYPFGVEVEMDWLAEWIKKMQEISPKFKFGVYAWVQYLDIVSEAVTKNPHWLVRDKQGNPVEQCLADDGKTVSGLSNLTEDLKEHILACYRGMLEKFNLDYIYLDGAMEGHSKIDWSTQQVIQEYEWYDLYERMRDLAREYGAAVHNNYAGSLYADMTYIEVPSFANISWQALGYRMYLSKLWQPENSFTVLIYPNDTNYYDYVLGFGVRPLPTQGYHYKLAEAAFEVKDMHPVIGVDLEPAWWRSDWVFLEAYPFSQGNASILTFINRDNYASNVEFSLSPAKFGLDTSKDVFVWLFTREDYLSEAVQQTYNLSLRHWKSIVDRGEDPPVMNASFLAHHRTVSNIMDFDIETKSGLLNMLVMTNSPAMLAAVEGKRTNFHLPSSLGVELSGQIIWEESRIEVNVDCDRNSADILVYVPEDWEVRKVTVNGIETDYLLKSISGQTFIEVSVEEASKLVEVYAN